jgi:chromosome segregation ATPase
MKNFQQNLLIVLALSLCGLCVYQWYGQSVQRNEIAGLTQSVYEKSAAIQGYTNSIQTMDHQIAELGARITELQLSARTNEEVINLQKRDIIRLQAASEGLTNQVAEYKKAVASLESKLTEAYDGIKKQNEALKELAAQRDEYVKKFNDSVKDRNDVVAKYNDLVQKVDKQQSGGKQ